MKRYYLCPLGQYPGESPGDSDTEPVIREHGLNYVVIYPATSGTWVLVRAAGPDHTGALADNRIIALPDITLDSTLGVLSTPQRNAILSEMAARGVDTSGINTQTAFREVVRRLGGFLSPGFSENKFDVSE